MTLIKFAKAIETAVATITWDFFVALKRNASQLWGIEIPLFCFQMLVQKGRVLQFH